MTGPGFILPDSGWLPAFGAAASPELVLDTIAAETFEYAKLYENDFVCCQRSQQSWLLLDLVCIKIVDQTDMTRMPALSKVGSRKEAADQNADHMHDLLFVWTSLNTVV